MDSYTSHPPYYGPTTPLCSYCQAQSSYPSPRYTSNGHYATNTIISGALRPCGESHYIRHSRAQGTSEAYPSVSARSFSFAKSPRPYRYPSASAFLNADILDGFPDEFIEIDKNVFIHIVNGSPVHRGEKCYQNEPHANEREKFGRREKTNQYTQHGLDYDDDRNEFIFTAAQRFNEPKSTWARKATTSSSRRPMSSSTKIPLVVPKATKSDARAYSIPAGYSLKNWDPTETPILLLGSVFDADSLGKWIYDWTVFRHGPATPISDIAGELWLLLIKLAGKVKRSEECMSRIMQKEDHNMVKDFVDAGEKLMNRLTKLLKTCEGPMLKAGPRKGTGIVLKDTAGVEFVETLFGRERQLEETEKFMASCRLWNMRFEANCEEILWNR